MNYAHTISKYLSIKCGLGTVGSGVSEVECAVTRKLQKYSQFQMTMHVDPRQWRRPTSVSWNLLNNFVNETRTSVSIVRLQIMCRPQILVGEVTRENPT